jgi:hypothetical protein
MPRRKNLAALAVIVIILVMVILPLSWSRPASLLQEASGLINRFQSCELNFAAMFIATWDIFFQKRLHDAGVASRVCS